MQILQEKLIWFLGCGSLLAIFFKTNLAHRLPDTQISVKLRTGLFLIVTGTIIGIISRLGILGQWLLDSGVSFYLESIFGYLIGWSLLIWGVIEWSGDYRARSDQPLAKSRLRLFTEKASGIILKEHTTNSLLEGISKYLLLSLDCQAVVLHKHEDNDTLSLIFQHGLQPESEQALQQPQRESIFVAAYRDRKITASDTSSDLHPHTRLESKGDPLICGLSMPVVSHDETLGVLSVLGTRQRAFDSGELEPLDIVCSALAATMEAEKTEHDLLYEEAFRKITKLISAPFAKDSSMISALVESAKLVQAQLSFWELNLYLPDNGRSRSHVFALPEGGNVNIHEGYFSKTDYSYLYKDTTNIFKAPERQALVMPLNIGNISAWLELRFENLRFAPDYLSELMKAWALLIAHKLGNEQLQKTQKQASQWLGAIRYCQERALSTDNVAAFLQEMATMIVDLELATFCRISLADPQKTLLKMAALAQTRPLNWSDERDEIPAAELELHYQALHERKIIAFNQDNQSRKISELEASSILPDGVRHGLIVPLSIGEDSVGLITMGEFRGGERTSGIAELFASNLAALISMVLSWHKEKRVSQEIIEGKKKLTIIQREPQKAPGEFTPKLRTRINGPLAGIMASCEYLHLSQRGIDGEVSHYLDIIERNAVRLHEITAEITA
jgi:GAF domain-containing protein